MKYQSFVIFIIPHSFTQTLKLSLTLPNVNPKISLSLRTMKLFIVETTNYLQYEILVRAHAPIMYLHAYVHLRIHLYDL